MKSSSTSEFVRLVQGFFADHLTQQKNVSPRTVMAYRDSFRLLFAYMQRHRRKAPTQLTLADLKATTLLGFLEDLEQVRHNTVRTRNARWAPLSVASCVTHKPRQPPNNWVRCKRLWLFR
jgi:site-specific recombinase XerD